MEGCTDLYRLNNSALTVIRYQDKSLDPLSDPALVQWILGSTCRTTITGLMWQEYGSSSWRMKEMIPLMAPIEHLWDVMFRSI